MIREQRAEQQLFYGAHEIARPATGNFYLVLDEVVKDWRRLAEPFGAAFSQGQGRPTDPVVYLKIFLVAYLENITYDTDLAERCSDSIAIRGFLGYGLTQQPPEHSSISRNRGLIGEHCEIEKVLERVVGLCEEQGLVSGVEAGVDASLVPANASLSSLRSISTGKSVRQHLQEVRERNREEGPKEKLKVSNEQFRSGSDPDARIAKKPGTPRGMYYQVTHVTDAKEGIIIGAGCARADSGEPEAAKPVLEQAAGTLKAQGQKLGRVVGDAGYDAADFHATLEQMGATPLTNYVADSTKKPERFKKASFGWDGKGDCYVCPAGRRLHRVQRQRDRVVYRADPAHCGACAHRSQCVGKGRVRQIHRHIHEASRQRNIARCHTQEGRAALRRRRHVAEPAFGHMKTYGGMGLMNCRGLAKARVKTVMGAVAWDLIKLVRAVTKTSKAKAAACAVPAVVSSRPHQALAAFWSAPLAVVSSLLARRLCTALHLIGNAASATHPTLALNRACS